MDRVLVVSDRLKELGSIASLSYSDKAEIERLYKEVLDKKFIRTSCNDCYRDAVIEMNVYLKKNGSMKEKSEYGLKNGALLQMGFGSSEMYTNANLTDEIAEKYLAKNPSGIKFFAKKPEDWEERVQKRLAPKVNDELIALMVEALNDGVTADSLKEEFAAYKLNGKTISKKTLELHVKKAAEIFSESAVKQVDEAKEEDGADEENNESQKEAPKEDEDGTTTE